MPKVKIGLIGLGAIGRVHFDCWRNSAHAELVAVSSRNSRTLAGEWGGQSFNLGDQAAKRVDLTAFARYASAEELIADPQVEAVDICLPTPLHAPLAVAALRAGKHVLCEKPMALSLDECALMERTAQECGRQLMIGHCLRYWPHYVKAHELLASGDFGRPLYARFHRSSAAPAWGGGSWHMNAAESGGVLDMHIHDVDVAHWWFGPAESRHTSGLVWDGVSLVIDNAWRYPDDLHVHLHAAWDLHGGAFRHAFRVVLEKATLLYDLALDPHALQILRGDQSETLRIEPASAYQLELDDFAASLNAGRAPTRCTPADSRLAVEAGLDALRQLGA
jgi:predicted dehydrogenase